MKELLVGALLASSVAYGAPSAQACHNITPWYPWCWLHETDSFTCPVLAVLFPPEGDIPGVWDCAPYNT